MTVEQFLAPYDTCLLECDGLTRVLHTILTNKAIPHTCWIGSLTVGGNETSPHFWMTLLDGRIIDYRARMWFGEQAPHGIFIPEASVSYEGEQVSLDVLPFALLRALTRYS